MQSIRHYATIPLLLSFYPSLVIASDSRIVALSGDSIVGTATGELDQIWSVGIDNRGMTTLFGSTDDSGSFGVFQEAAGVLQKVVIEGDLLPSNYFRQYSATNSNLYMIDNAGTVWFGTGYGGIWRSKDGTIAKVAEGGDSAPSTPGARLRGPMQFLINDVGDATISSAVDVGGGGRWITDGLSWQKIVPRGDVSGYDGRRGPAAVNDAGHTAFIAGSWNQTAGVWTTRNGDLASIASTVSAPPGISDATFGPTFSRPRMNNQGDVAFWNVLEGPAITTSNDQTLWIDNGHDLRLVAREGVPAAGAPPGILFHSFVRGPDNFPERPLFELNDLGQVAFRSTLKGAGVTAENDEAIFLGGADGLQLLVREGDPLPGASAGVFGALGDPLLNGRGQIAFMSAVIGGPVGFGNDMAIFATDIAGQLEKIVAVGDHVETGEELSPAAETITSLIFAGYSSTDSIPSVWIRGPGDRLMSFNDDGEVVFAARLSGGSYVAIVSSAVAVPEPSGAFVIAILFSYVAVGARFRSRR